MAEDDGPDLEIRDGSPALLEELLARTRPSKRPPAAVDKPEPQSEAERIFQEWLDRTAPE
jgi:hypothetical protein